jgi:hypothetical protein
VEEVKIKLSVLDQKLMGRLISCQERRDY